ncbi:MAG: imidazole glycerol phosphate synthase subunit HisF [Myxococcales bacterium]|nr:imidazole glycerol phosphate synthase subunit HisF [Myxococcales bacterium]
MLTRRIIPCLDVKAGRVVKGVQFQGLRDAGDPVALARRYDEEGADELTFLDITASSDKRKTLAELVERVSKELFIPFTVGGGIRTLDDMHAMLDAGADKVSIGTAAVRDPTLISRASARFGAQFLVISLDIKRVGDRWLLTTHGGRTLTDVDALDFAVRMAESGAGELLLNDMAADGTQDGFGIELLQAMSSRVHIPLIASGGAGTCQHFVDAVSQGGADAVLAASVFHFGTLSISQVKSAMASAGIPIRPTHTTPLASGAPA